MSERFDYPLDLGIVLYSTCTSIWNEEVERDKGLMAVRKVCACDNPSCRRSTREHLQHLFDGDEDDLKAVAAFLAPYWEETKEELRDRFRQFRANEQIMAQRKAGVQPPPPPTFTLHDFRGG